jgi:hypothetical protein
MSPLAPHLQNEPRQSTIPWIPVGVGTAVVTAAIALLVWPSGEPPKPVAVAGRVTWRGNPVSGGTIVFAPDYRKGHTGELGMAVLDYQGHYEIQTDGKPGLLPGWYAITVAPPGPSPSGWPYKYHHPESSGLVCEVKQDGNAAFDFNLE